MHDEKPTCLIANLIKAIILNTNRCIFGKKITKTVFQHKPRIFFLFFDLDFIDLLGNFRWYSRLF